MQYMIYHLLIQLLHVLAPRSNSQGVIYDKRCISQHVNLGSAPPFRNDYNLKMLKYIKLISINHNYDTKMCNNEPSGVPVLSYKACSKKDQTFL